MEPPFPSSLKIALKIQFLAIFSQFFKISFFRGLELFLSIFVYPLASKSVGGDILTNCYPS